MQRKACGAKAAHVRLLASLCVIAAARRRWPLWPGAKAGFEKIGSHPDANGEHLFQKVKARKLVPPNLGLPTTAAAACAAETAAAYAAAATAAVYCDRA